jgi:hypothetical protein
MERTSIMPKVSERRRQLHEIAFQVQTRLLFRQYRDAIGEQDDGEDHIDDMVIMAYTMVRRSTRYKARLSPRNLFGIVTRVRKRVP